MPYPSAIIWKPWSNCRLHEYGQKYASFLETLTALEQSTPNEMSGVKEDNGKKFKWPKLMWPDQQNNKVVVIYNQFVMQFYKIM